MTWNLVFLNNLGVNLGQGMPRLRVWKFHASWGDHYTEVTEVGDGSVLLQKSAMWQCDHFNLWMKYWSSAISKVKKSIVLIFLRSYPCLALVFCRNTDFTDINQSNLWNENLAYEMKNWRNLFVSAENECHKCANNISLACISHSVFFCEFILWRPVAKLHFNYVRC